MRKVLRKILVVAAVLGVLVAVGWVTSACEERTVPLLLILVLMVAWFLSREEPQDTLQPSLEELAVMDEALFIWRDELERALKEGRATVGGDEAMRLIRIGSGLKFKVQQLERFVTE